MIKFKPPVDRDDRVAIVTTLDPDGDVLIHAERDGKSITIAYIGQDGAFHSYGQGGGARETLEAWGFKLEGYRVAGFAE